MKLQTAKQYILLLLGCIATILGTIGIVVPGLPTTPLVLLASFLGKYIREYQAKGGISIHKRIYIILLMSAMVASSTIFFIQNTALRLIVISAGVIGCIVVGFVVPKEKK